MTIHVNSDADKNEPATEPVSIHRNMQPDAADSISNKDELPEGTTYVFVESIDTSTPGGKQGIVVVTYPDGSTDEIVVQINVKNDASNYIPTGQNITVDKDDEPQAENAISNKDDLPAGTTYKFKSPVDMSTPGDKSAIVVVTYPDGSTSEVPVSVHVTSDAENNVPRPAIISLNKGDTPEADDAIANKDELPEGTTFEMKEPGVDTSTPGNKIATVVVRYPDGSVKKLMYQSILNRCR